MMKMDEMRNQIYNVLFPNPVIKFVSQNLLLKQSF